MHSVQMGSRRPEVMVAQRFHNLVMQGNLSALSLTEDGIFGIQTDRAIRAFQARRGLAQDGVVGHATWQALGLRLEVERQVRLIGQHTSMSCWSACAAMALGIQASVGPGGAETAGARQSLPAPSRVGGLLPELANVETFARSIGYRVMSPPANGAGFAPHLRRAPAILCGRRGTGGRHAVVVSAVWNNNDPSGQDAILRIHNPSPLGNGSIEGTLYPFMMIEGGTFTPELLLVR